MVLSEERVLANPRRDHAWEAEPPSRAALALHRELPGYAPSPLRRLERTARELGIGALLAKDESARLGLPAFKVLGASWAVHRALARRAPGLAPEDWAEDERLRARLAPLGGLRLVTASDGNHGRAVARVARRAGLGALVLLPEGAARARVAAIEGEGARVRLVAGGYDAAVRRAAEEARAPGSLLVQDTSWPGYEEVPRWIVEGYATLFHELEDALAVSGEPAPDLVLVQVGVGSLAAAALAHLRARGRRARPTVAAVEPFGADSAMAAAAAGELVSLPPSGGTSMAGLDCGTIATIALEPLLRGADLFVAVGDARADEAVRLLDREGLAVGASGAAGLAGLLALLDDREARASLRLGPQTRALVLLTEGDTDPDARRCGGD